MWGFSSSPLVAGGMVIVYAGAPGEKGLLAYHADNGEPAWTAATGHESYSSPQLITLGQEQQVVLLSDHGLTAVSPETGKVRWEYNDARPQTWRVAQPRQIGEKSIVIGSEDLGLVRLDLTLAAVAWTPNVAWKSNAMLPAYNDFVYLDNNLYGFDKEIFCCVDAQTGKRRWKGGRYGHGQVVLVADQRLLVVISEYGEVVLLSANPEKHHELGRLQAVEGKTWNHPVIAHGKLFARNSEEVACYSLLTVKKGTQAAR
jgi:outer membrane protein assembly factor BamB